MKNINHITNNMKPLLKQESGSLQQELDDLHVHNKVRLLRISWKVMSRLLIVLLVVSSNLSGAQNLTNVEEQQVSPLSPHASSLGQYGSTPVSLYTGIPNIQVPIYQVQVRDFVLPISLSYHAGGVKVEDKPSWVGMGWTLNAGGMVSRQMRGALDERMIDEKSNYQSHIDIINNESSTPAQVQTSINSLIEGNYDTESDIFSINAGSLSQQFFMDTDGGKFCLPANKLLIQDEERIDFGVNYIDSQVARWRVTDKKGIQYLFGRSTAISNSGSLDGVELYTNEANCIGWTSGNVMNSGEPQFVSSWYLSEIILPTGESIVFSYDTYSFCTQQNLKGTFVIGSWASGPGSNPYSFSSGSGINYIQALRMKEITFPSGKVRFIAGDDRRDMLEGKVLDSIKIYSKVIGGYELQKYFVIDTNNPDGNTIVGDNSFRLALQSVQEFDENNQGVPPYLFEYENEVEANFGLPATTSFAQDIFGYYNGQNANTSLIPSYIFRNDNGSFYYYYDGANRSISTAYAKYGVLKKITYPTGGSTQFFYESNVSRGIGPINPLQNLRNMEVIPFTNRSGGASVENTNGTDEGYSSTFEIFSSVGVDVDVFAQIMGGNANCVPYEPLPGSGYLHDCFNISFEEEVTPGNYTIINTEVYSGRSYNFLPGKYRVKVKWIQGGALIGEYAQLSLSWQDYAIPTAPVVDSTTEMTVGGLRVSKIIDTDPVTSVTTARKFGYQGDLQVFGNPTSGTIMTSPLNGYSRNYYDYFVGTTLVSIHNAFVLTSYSNASSLQTKGGYVGYKKVTVDYGENAEAGRTVTYFSSLEDYPDGDLANSQEFPFPPAIDYDWRRGLVTSQIDYKNVSGVFEPVKTVAHNYTFNSSPLNINYKSHSQIKITPIPALGTFGWKTDYPTNTESYFENGNLTTVHSPLGDVTTSITYEQNEDVLEMSSTTTTNSDGDVIYTRVKYPKDYGSVENIETLVNRNIISIPIKIESSVNGIQTAGKVTKLSDQGKPVEVYAYENSTANNLPAHGTTVIVPSNYQSRISYQYNPSSKLLEESAYKDNLKKAFLWGYHNTYPIVTGENISIATLEAAVASSINSLSGYSNGLDDMETLLSDIRGLDTPAKRATWASFNVNLRAQSGLGEAFVTTYTYDPLIGMTSQTDPNGQTTYFKYDDLGRLQTITDFEGNPLAKTDYHYSE